MGLDDLIGNGSRKQDGNDDTDRIIRLDDRRVGHADPFAVFLVAVYPNLESSRRRKAHDDQGDAAGCKFQIFQVFHEGRFIPLIRYTGLFREGHDHRQDGDDSADNREQVKQGRVRHLSRSRKHDHERQDELADSDEQFRHDAGKSAAADEDFHSSRNDTAVKAGITDTTDKAGNIGHRQIIGKGDA